MDDQKQPLISVLIPVYNTRAYLPEALDSVLGQTYKNLDVVLVDDGSTDGSAELCDLYEQKDARVRVIHQPNGGVAAARNRLISEIRGAYAAWVDSDDVCAPDMLSYLYDGIVAYNADIAHCGQTIRADAFGKTGAYNVLDGRAMALDDPKASEGICEDWGLFMQMTRKLFRRSLLEGVTVPSISIGEDSYTMHALYLKDPRVLLLPEVKYYYRQREGSLIHSITPENMDGYFRCMQSLPNISKYTVLRLIYSDGHELALSLSRFPAQYEQYKALAQTMFSRVRENKHALITAGFLGMLGKIEVAALATGKPWSWRFVALCQRLYEIRAKGK